MAIGTNVAGSYVDQLNQQINQLKNQWMAARDRGASQAELDAIHAQAEALRALGGTLGANQVTAETLAWYASRGETTHGLRVGDYNPWSQSPTAFPQLDTQQLPRPDTAAGRELSKQIAKGQLQFQPVPVTQPSGDPLYSTQTLSWSGWGSGNLGGLYGSPPAPSSGAAAGGVNPMLVAGGLAVGIIGIMLLGSGKSRKGGQAA